MISSFINGSWCSNGERFDIISPVDGSCYHQVVSASSEDANRAIDAAHEAFPQWAAISVVEREQFLTKIADAIESLSSEIEEALIMETGAWIGKAKGEVQAAIGMFRAAASIVHQVQGYDLTSPAGKRSTVIREPLGVVSVITPWNVPLGLSSRTTSGILATGNTLVLKPSELSPACGGYFLAKAVQLAGVADGVFNVLTCSRQQVAEVGNAMVTHDAVKAISFTGSTSVGKRLAGVASSHLKKVSMELGGKDAMIILADSDLTQAIGAATFSSFHHAGQICMATKRIFVDDAIAETFIERFITNTNSLGYGNVREMSKPIAPLINQQQVDKIVHQIDDAISKGASLLAGGKVDGLYIQPTILADVTPQMAVYDEESFGPLVCIYPFSTIERAVEQLNQSEYGLSASIFTNNIERGQQIATQIQSGICHINDGTIYAEPLAPFGGVKNSGMGRYGGMASVESFTQTRWITSTDSLMKYPPMFTETS